MVHTILKTSLKLVIACLILGAGSNAWAEPQIYLGTATMDVWYGGLGLQTLQRRYQQNVVVDIGAPLQTEANTEQNPFYYEAKALEAAGQPGSFAIYSAYIYVPDQTDPFGPGDDGPPVVWQYWWYSEYQGSYQGTYLPDLSNRDNFNIIVAEDATGYLPFCVVNIAPESTIDITFEDNTVTTKVAGTVYDPLIQQLCTSYIERVEISINAQAVQDN
jgi:hypothetical protein